MGTHWRALNELSPMVGLLLCLPFHRANERHAKQLLHPNGLSVPELNPNRVRVVVFRDEKGVKQEVFDSQQLTNEGDVS